MSWIFSRSLMEMYADADYANSLFSQEGVEESSEVSCSGGGLFAELNVMPTRHKFWHNDKTMEASKLSRFGRTLHLLTDDLGGDVLMWYRAVFHAKTSVRRVKVQESREKDPDSGKSLNGLLARYDPASCSWKTRRCSLLEDSVLSLETWPRWGMWEDGESYLQQTAVPPTSENAAGYWLGTPTASMSVRSEEWRGGAKLPTPAEFALGKQVGHPNSYSNLTQQIKAGWLPTPRCIATSGSRIITDDGVRTNRAGTMRFGISLSDLVKRPNLMQQRKERFATPTTMDRLLPKSPAALAREATTARPGRSRPANLRDQVSNAQNWPTPCCHDYKVGVNGYGLGALIKKLPTPTATMYKGWSPGHNRADGDDRLDYTIEREANQAGTPGHLNPTWVEGMMGWLAGWTSLEPLDPALMQDFIDQRGASGWADGSWQHRCSPFVSGKTPFRNERIMAIGNGQVSLCAATAFTLLLERLNKK